MLILLDRNRDGGDDPWLLAKVRLFSIGAALAIGGILLDLSWLIWGAIAALSGGVLLRFVSRPGAAGTAAEGEEDGTRPVSEDGPGRS